MSEPFSWLKPSPSQLSFCKHCQKQTTSKQHKNIIHCSECLNIKGIIDTETET